MGCGKCDGGGELWVVGCVGVVVGVGVLCVDYARGSGYGLLNFCAFCMQRVL